MEWICALLTITTSELLARKLWWAWIVALINNGFWYAYSIQTEQYGMLFLTIVCTMQGIRGLRRWRSEAKIQQLGLKLS